MIDSFVNNHQLPSYRIKQFNQAYYQQLVPSYDHITGWPKSLREEFEKFFPFSSLDVKKRLVSQRMDTIKVLFARKKDQQMIETVLMKHDDGRNTICVSCMVGCPVNCSFCATGKLGFNGNLEAREIVDQVLYFARELKETNESVSNVVFMGMGEPMLNLKEVMTAMQTLRDGEKFGLSTRRVTISTSGYVPQLKQLIASGFKGRLAISLHAPNQALRERLMPVAKVYPLDQLMAVLDDYTKQSNKRITYEYILIKDVTDQVEHANQLGDLLKNRLAHVNLIPYNPVPGESFVRPDKKSIFRFDHILKQHGVPSSVRVTMGDDIKAACGQLAANINP